MAAIAIAEGMQVPMETILTVIRGFHAVEHRIEFVATKGGVDYYNDSKGTNPDAAIQGIKAMSRPTVLIGGGYDKQSEYDEWIDSFDGKVNASSSSDRPERRLPSVPESMASIRSVSRTLMRNA